MAPEVEELDRAMTALMKKVFEEGMNVGQQYGIPNGVLGQRAYDEEFEQFAKRMGVTINERRERNYEV